MTLAGLMALAAAAKSAVAAALHRLLESDRRDAPECGIDLADLEFLVDQELRAAERRLHRNCQAARRGFLAPIDRARAVGRKSQGAAQGFG